MNDTQQTATHTLYNIYKNILKKIIEISFILTQKISKKVIK